MSPSRRAALQGAGQQHGGAGDAVDSQAGDGMKQGKCETKAADEIERLRAERDDYKSRWEQVGCTRHHAMETAIRLAEERSRTISELRATLDAVREYIDALDLIEPPSTQAQQFCHAVRSILEANDE